MKIGEVWKLKSIDDFTEALKQNVSPMTPLIRIVGIRYVETIDFKGKKYNHNDDMIAVCPQYMSTAEAKERKPKGEWSECMGRLLLLGKYELASDLFVEKYKKDNILAWVMK